MWNGISTSTTIQIRCIPTSIANSTTHFPSLTVSASRSSDQVSLKSLGLAVLNLTASNKSKYKRDEELVVDGGEGQLSGSDVLLALQQADLKKKNKKKRSSRGVIKGKKESSLSGSGNSEDDDDDDDEDFEVKPLRIKSDWGKRIDELDKRLQEIPEI